MSADPRNATLVTRRDLDSHHTVFTVRPDTPLAFTAGQWTELGLPKVGEGQYGPSGDEFVKDGVVRRAYSICSAPGSEDLEFYFNKVDSGQLTRWLWDVPEGGRLFVDPEARGHFTLDSAGIVDHAHNRLTGETPDSHPAPGIYTGDQPDHPRSPGINTGGMSKGGSTSPSRPDLLFVATGTGLAPFMSLIRHHAVHRRVDNPVPWRHLVLLHGTRNRALLAFEDELRSISRRARYQVSYLPMLSREPDGTGWHDLRGRVTDVVRELFASPNDRRLLSGTDTAPARALDPARCHAYLCGNSTMIAMVEGELQPLGMTPRWMDPAGTIHTEVYY